MTDQLQDDDPEGDANALTRRKWLQRSAVGGAVIVGGAVAGGAVAATQDSNISVRRESIVWEVACLGDTFRSRPFPDPPEVGDDRGATFSVEGWIYPKGTIPGDGFIPTEEGSIGRWFCGGYVINSAERPEPHVNATANFVLGSISETNPYPPDSLVTHGLGVAPGFPERSQIPIIGGSGKYVGALGHGGRVVSNFNTTVLYGIGNPAPNFEYTFDLLMIT